MKVHTISFRRKFFRLVLFTGVCVLLLSIVRVGAQADELRVLRVLQNEENANIVAVVVSGIFREDDLVNIYSNDSFIKGRVVGVDDASGTVTELRVGNISADVFVGGENNIVARLERRGIVEQQSQPFLLRVRNTPSRPVITVSSDSEAGVYTPVVSGGFEAGDTVVVFLNGDEIRTKELSESEAEQGIIILAPLAIEELRTGENNFAAVIRRGTAVSHRATFDGTIVIGEESEEDAAEEPAPEPEVEREEPEPEEPAPEIGPECVTYTLTDTLYEESDENHLHLGRRVAVGGDIIAATTDRNRTLLYHSGDDGWSEPRVVQEREYGGSGAGKTSLAVGDGIVTIGMPNSGTNGVFSGAVHAYHRPTVFGWIVQSSLIPASLDSYNLFGVSVARNDSMLIVGAEERDRSGSVYIFNRLADGRWSVPTKLVPEDSKRNQLFGHAVSMHGSRFAVGAPGDTEAGFKAGAVYVYSLTDGRWSVQKILPDGYTASIFGREIVLHDDMLFVGVERGGMDGVVHVYTTDGTEWNLKQTISPSPDDDAGLFGASLAYSDGILVVGAPTSGDGGTDGVYKTGAVFTYVRIGDTWSRQEKIIPDGVENGDRIGGSVAFDGTRIAAAAHRDDTGGLNAGAVYVYHAEPVMCGVEEPEEEQPAVSETIDILSENTLLLEELFAGVDAIVARLERDFQRIIERNKKKEERIVVFDENSVRADAQRRAAEVRRIIGPGLPGEITIAVTTDDGDDTDAPEDDAAVRSREEVVGETRENVGVVVPTGSRTLRVGDTDDEVYRLQAFLNENGYTVARIGPGSPGNETNTFDTATRRALESFQLVNGIPVSGVLDQPTRDMILTFVSRF